MPPPRRVARQRQHVWAGYCSTRSQAQREQGDARRAALAPEEQAAEDAESEAAYRADMADAAREPYDPYEGKYQEMAWEAQEEERSDE
ncbi:hypothetical protein [Streptomyces sp. NPDC057002]|uniref:hypothetical protein n=1 Tax=Streptomyces sp. NPDC057002 TaxID=3345992 RepID=UPI003638B131